MPTSYKGDEFGFEERYAQMWLEDDGVLFGDTDVFVNKVIGDGILVDEIYLDEMYNQELEDEGEWDGHPWVEVSISCPVDADGYKCLDAVQNAGLGLFGDDPFEGSDPMIRPVLEVAFSDGSVRRDEADRIIDFMDRRGYTMDDVETVNGLPWPTH